MALYMDGPVSTIEDLRAEDSQLNAVASIEGVDVTQKLALAKEDVGFDLERLLDGKQPLGKVLLTRALQVWHVYRTLEMMYRDAYFTHLNDRYKKKRNMFHELAMDAREHVIHRGVSIVLNPIRRDFDAGGGSMRRRMASKRDRICSSCPPTFLSSCSSLIANSLWPAAN